MKYLIFIFLLLTGNSWADTQTIANRSSRTITADSVIRIPNSHSGDILFRILITSPSSTLGAVLRVYDSSAQATNLIAQINLSTAPFGGIVDPVKLYEFDLKVTSAITYTTTNGADVTILWKKDDFSSTQ